MIHIGMTLCARDNMCSYRFRSCYSDPGEKFYLAASPFLGPGEDLSAAADLIEVFCRTRRKKFADR